MLITLPTSTPIRKGVILAIILAFVFSLIGFVGNATPANAANITLSQCSNSVPDNVGGRGVTCDVEIVNNLNVATGETSSVTTVNICSGAANAPLTCVVTVSESVDIITSVEQCNGITNGGGGALDCSVSVINNIIGEGTVSEATVNQCNGSGQGGGTEPIVVCNPDDASTTNATVTQCNGSGNEGGGDNRVLCVVNPSTISSLLPVTINQCNGSSNGGGATVICDSVITTNILPVVVIPPTEPPVVIPPTEPPVVTPPVVIPPTEPPVVTPPVVNPPVVVPPVVTPPVVNPPVVVPPVVTPPVVNPPVVVPPTEPPVVTPPVVVVPVNNNPNTPTNPNNPNSPNTPNNPDAPKIIKNGGEDFLPLGLASGLLLLGATLLLVRKKVNSNVN